MVTFPSHGWFVKKSFLYHCGFLGADWQCLLLQAEYFYEFLSLRSLDKGIMADPTVNVPLLGTVPHKASGGWPLLWRSLFISLNGDEMIQGIYAIHLSDYGMFSWGELLNWGQFSHCPFRQRTRMRIKKWWVYSFLKAQDSPDQTHS